MAQIHRYIYTRLPKEQSPHNKHGFQSAFVPEQWNERGIILELESRIHFPTYDGFTEKRFVFHRELGGQLHLVWMHLQLLPEARDEQGRGGIFLVQGFMVPPEIHEELREPEQIWPALRNHLFADREAIFQSDSVDLEKGTIKALDLNPDAISPLTSTHRPPLVEWEQKLLSFLVKQQQGQVDDWVLVLKGKIDKVEWEMNRLAGFLPRVVRNGMGWDPAFDGGKIFFSAFKTFGYHHQEPVTGQPLIFDLDQNAFLDASLDHLLLGRDHPFDRFLAQTLHPSTSQDEIDRTFDLSVSLFKGEGVPQGHALEGSFAAIIEDLARGYLEQGLIGQLPRPWVTSLRDDLPYGEVVRLLNGRLAPAMVAEALGGHILQGRIHPGSISEPLPQTTLDKSGPLLKVLHSMWTKREAPMDQVQAVGSTERERAFSLMGTTQLVKEDWFFRLVAAFPRTFKNLATDREFAGHANDWITRKIPRTFGKLKENMAEFMVKQGLFEGLDQEQPNWNRYLEVYAQQNQYDQSELKAMVKAVRKQNTPPEAAPFLKALAFPGDSIPPSVGMNYGYRTRLAQALVLCHGYNKARLLAYGFSQEEAHAALNNRKGLWGKIRNILGI